MNPANGYPHPVEADKEVNPLKLKLYFLQKLGLKGSKK